VHCKLKTYWEKYYIGATGTGLSRWHSKWVIL
jgi:hypothetical protein